MRVQNCGNGFCFKLETAGGVDVVDRSRHSRHLGHFIIPHTFCNVKFMILRLTAYCIINIELPSATLGMYCRSWYKAEIRTKALNVTHAMCADMAAH